MNDVQLNNGNVLRILDKDTVLLISGYGCEDDWVTTDVVKLDRESVKIVASELVKFLKGEVS